MNQNNEHYRLSALFEKKINLEFYEQKTETVAELLIGKLMVINGGKEGNIRVCRICETEAYLAENDMSSHSYCGKTPRNEAMFGMPGTFYVYKIYGIHRCVNVVTEQNGVGSAVLLRAAEPVAGIENMYRLRFGKEIAIGKITDKDILRLLKGPANLTKGLGIDIHMNKESLLGTDIFIADDGFRCSVNKSTRIGITKSEDLMLRFYEAGSKFVSGKK